MAIYETDPNEDQRTRNEEQAASPEEYLKSHFTSTFGDSKQPGILGTGAYNFNPYQPNGTASAIPGYQGFQDALQRNIGGLDARQGVHLDTRNSDAIRAQQMGLSQSLAQSAYGQGGPSLAALQGQRAQQNNLMSALQGMSANRQNHLAQNGIYGALAQAGSAANAQSGFQRAGEQAQAQASLGNVLSGGRTSDIGAATSQAQLNQQDQIQRAQMVQKYLGMGGNLAQAQQATDQDMAQMMAKYSSQLEDIKLHNYQQRAQQNKAMLSSLLGGGQQMAGAGGGGGGGGDGGELNWLSQDGGYSDASSGMAVDMGNMSDERVKKDVKPGEEKVRAFLDALSPHIYKYKDKTDGEGEHLSVMAQELEKSDLGKEFVKETPRGKRVDYGKGLETMKAAAEYLEKRMKAMEAKRHA